MLLSIFFYASCTKEVSREQEIIEVPITDTTQVAKDTIPSSANGGFLKRIVSHQEGSKDSMVYTFKYADDGKLIEMYAVVEGNNELDDMYSLLQRFHRNDKGLVDEIKLQSYFYDASRKPTIHWNSDYKIYLDATKSKYQYALLTGVGENEPIADSIVFGYSLENKLSTVAVYNLVANDTGHLNDKYEYTYNSKGNISKWNATAVRNYPDREVWFNNEFTYDDKINPVNFGEEMLLTGDFIFPALPTANNFTVCNNTIHPEESYAVQYTYNSHNKPTAAIWKYSNGEVTTIKYYYLK